MFEVIKKVIHSQLLEVKASGYCGSPIYYLTLYFLIIIAEIPACDAATLILVNN